MRSWKRLFRAEKPLRAAPAEILEEAIENDDAMLAKQALTSATNLVNIRGKNGQTPLFSAGKAVREVLLEYGADINSKNDDGMTSLHLALIYSSYDTADFLISRGADVNARTNNGRTPLHVAHTVQLVRYLLNHGADLGARTTGTFRGGWTPLHSAADNEDQSDIIETLLKHGADVSSRSDEGLTPLHIAAARSYVANVETLIAYKARIDIKDERGRTPLDEATRDLDSIEQTLLEHSVGGLSGRQQVVRILLDTAGMPPNRKINEDANGLDLGADGKVACKECGARILPLTANDNNGLCMPCVKRDVMVKVKNLIDRTLSDTTFKEIDSGDKETLDFFDQEVPEGDSICSDDACPCGLVTVLPRDTGYLYIERELVMFRSEYRSQADAAQAMEKMMTAKRVPPGSIYRVGPILVCERGARQRKLDLQVAAADAKYWWFMGRVPLRATPFVGVPNEHMQDPSLNFCTPWQL